MEWEKIKAAYELVKTNEMVKRVDLKELNVAVYVIPSSENPKNLIRIDIKEK